MNGTERLQQALLAARSGLTCAVNAAWELARSRERGPGGVFGTQAARLEGLRRQVDGELAPATNGERGAGPCPCPLCRAGRDGEGDRFVTVWGLVE